jgi:hypothetical protein
MFDRRKKFVLLAIFIKARLGIWSVRAVAEGGLGINRPGIAGGSNF